jgi:ubiquinone/menaquinone biosynthesis C-methylase UbiE
MVLDLGCGYGRVASQLVAAGFTNVRGYDASAMMIERARTQHPELNLSVGNAEHLPELDGSFDAVVVSALFTSIPDPQQQRTVVAEVRRVLKAGGTVHGVEFLRESGSRSGAYRSGVGIALWHFEPGELRTLFSDFVGWESWRQDVPSVSGKKAAVLQFVAHAT